MRRMSTLMVPALLSVLIACSADDDPAGPGAGSGTFAATVDGQAWSGAVQSQSTGYDGFTFGVVGIDSGIEILLTVNTLDPDNALPGTVDLTDGSTGAELREGGDTWFAVGEGGSGTMTVTAIDSNGATGTFSFVAGPVGGSAPDGTRSVANGSFNLVF